MYSSTPLDDNLREELQIPYSTHYSMKLSDKELREAFTFFSGGKEQVTVSSLRSRLRVFGKELPARDLRKLTNDHLAKPWREGARRLH